MILNLNYSDEELAKTKYRKSASKIEKESKFYADLNLPVIPLCPHNHANMGRKHREKCKSPGKAPIIFDWQNHIHTTPEMVNEWFLRNPFSNIGLVLGQTTFWNIVGIDVDGEFGQKMLMEWSDNDLPVTWEYTTGNGKRYLYRLPANFVSHKVFISSPDGTGELALICQGQQTVLPPSIHPSGARYTWVKGKSPHDIPIGDAPEWIIQRIQSDSAMESNLGHRLENWTDDKISEPVKPEEFTEKITEGGRNNKLAKLTGVLVARRNIPLESIKNMIWAENLAVCFPPLNRDETDAIVESIWKSEQMKNDKREKQKQKRDEGMNPVPYAQKFLNTQRSKGFLWKFIVSRGTFYRYDTQDPVWRAYDPAFMSPDILKMLLEEDKTFATSRNVAEVIRILEMLLADPKNDDIFEVGLYGDINNVYTNNGILDWRTKTLSPWNPSCNSTIKLPADWDETATESEAYKQWEETMESWIPDKNTRMFLQEFIGYCLIPDTSRRQAVFLYGRGHNGKSLFIDVVSKLFGTHLSVLDLKRVSGKYDTVNLIDKFINICADIDSTYMKETGLLKAMISGDRINGEYKYGRTFEFVPTARLIFSANELPKVSDKTEGWYSRWAIVHFPKSFKVDPLYKRNLLATMHSPNGLSALLAWAVEGLVRLESNGTFTESISMENSKRLYMHENDNVAGFADTVIEPVFDPSAEEHIQTTEMYDIYMHWCELEGTKAVGKNQFLKRIENHGYERGKKRLRKGQSGKQCFLNVKLNENCDAYGELKEFQQINYGSYRSVN